MRTLTVTFLDRFSSKLAHTLKKPKSKNEFVGVNIAPLFPHFAPKTPIFRPRNRENLCKYYSELAFVHNFDKCWPNFTILSLLYSPRYVQQNSCHNAHHTLHVSLRYLATKLMPQRPSHLTCVVALSCKT